MERKRWLGPWEQWFWTGLKGPTWLWMRIHAGGSVIVYPDGEVIEYEPSHLMMAGYRRKEWMQTHGTPANMGTERPDRVEPGARPVP